ncbi:MAG: hypothetical protein MMC33_006975 [Icmadophila ericetorum]|nr:hypothetical protein [Icmadophila ericetorum]
MVKRWEEEARMYLELKDRNKQVKELEPAAKKESFFFFMPLLQGYTPPPGTPSYQNFGFGTCTSEYEEGNLGNLCIKLFGIDRIHHPEIAYFEDSVCKARGLTTCTFTEFWQAYEKKKLPQLLDSHGFRNKRLGFRHLETYLNSGDLKPSVWELIDFLKRDQDFEAPLPVQVDYGFRNCTSVREKLELKRFYTELLGNSGGLLGSFLPNCGDPMDLHEACLQNKIYEYACHVLGDEKVDPQLRGLLTNVYTL